MNDKKQRSLKIIKYLNAKEWRQIAINFFFIVSQVWFDLKLPDYMSTITKLVQTPGSEMSEILKQGGLMLLCALGSGVSTVIVGFFATRIASSFSQRLRSLLFSKVNSFSTNEINQFSTASLITRSTNDVTQIQLITSMVLQVMIKAPIMTAWALSKIAGKGLEWSIATGVAVLILVATIALITIFVLPKFRKIQAITDSLNQITRENLTGLRVVRAYNAEEFQKEKFEKVNKELTQTHLFTSRGMAVLSPMMNLTMNGITLAIYWIGAYLISNASMIDKLPIFSNMVVFSAYAMKVIMPFMMFAMMSILLPRASVSANRINEVLDTAPSILDGTEDGHQPRVVGKVEFKNVSFKYPGATNCVLKNISFTAKQGETIAFIGSTGSGKSTLVNLLLRFHDVTKGEVLIDEVNVKDYLSEALYNKIGYVPQKPVLFKGTVKSNVNYGETGKEDVVDKKDATDNEIKKAVAVAQATEFVESMKKQYEADISQVGLNLSGGQKQRIAIARAVYRKPEIYIFDDSFSALDYKTDRLLRSALKKESAGVTTLIVAQRVGTIMDADQIIVLNDGVMVGKGTHQELLSSCQVYKEIALSQLSEEELLS